MDSDAIALPPPPPPDPIEDALLFILLLLPLIEEEMVCGSRDCCLATANLDRATCDAPWPPGDVAALPETFELYAAIALAKPAAAAEDRGGGGDDIVAPFPDC